MKVPKLNPVTWATDLLTDAEEWAVIICGIWVLCMLRKKQKHSEQAMSLQQATFWARDTAYDLWRLLHPVKQRRYYDLWLFITRTETVGDGLCPIGIIKVCFCLPRRYDMIEVLMLV